MADYEKRGLIIMDMEEIKRKLAPVVERYDIEFDAGCINGCITINEPEYVNIPYKKITNITDSKAAVDIRTKALIFCMWKNVDKTHMTVL